MVGRTLASGMIALAGSALVPVSAAQAQPSTEVKQLRSQLDDARRRIDQLEQRLDAMAAQPAGTAVVGAPAGQPGTALAQVGTPPAQVGTPLQPVGEAPADLDRPPELAVLGEQGALITRRGQLTGELQLGYTRADRNRALFRGIQLLDTVLVGVFDINESHQDVLDASLGLRYGLTDRLEAGVRVPFIHRSDKSVLTPIAGSTNDDAGRTIDSSSKGSGIGDIEAMLRYQINRPSAGKPFFVANLQAVAPTGSDPFRVDRDETGRALQAATGAGFWSISPSLTAILPTDPAVLFGSLGFTHSFARNVNSDIGPVRLTRVDPGDSLSVTAGIGLGLNERTSLNLGYAHSWAFGTRTTTQALDPGNDDPGPATARARDLQIGRFLFGVTYRVSDATSVNWGIEVGATDDAPDLRTTLRIPMTLLGSGQ